MGQNSHQALGIASFILGRSQRRSQASLVLRDRAFHMPAMSVHAPVKPTLHLSSIAAFRPLPGVPFVGRDDRRADAQFLAGEAMVVLAVVARVPDQPVDREMATRLPDRFRKLRRVLTRAVAHHGPGKQVGVGVTHQGELGPMAPQESFVPDAMNVMAGGMSTLQAGRVNDGFRLGLDQATRFSKAENRLKELVERPFFSSRSCAYLRVE